MSFLGCTGSARLMTCTAPPPQIRIPEDNGHSRDAGSLGATRILRPGVRPYRGWLCDRARAPGDAQGQSGAGNKTGRGEGVLTALSAADTSGAATEGRPYEWPVIRPCPQGTARCAPTCRPPGRGRCLARCSAVAGAAARSGSAEVRTPRWGDRGAVWPGQWRPCGPHALS